MNNLPCKVFFQLLQRDLRSFWREYPGKFFDTAFLFFTNVIVFSYFMPQESVNESYGPFLMIGAITSFGLIEVIGKVSLFISDIEGEKTISQKLILPVKSSTIFAYVAIFWAISSLLLACPLFVLGKLLLYKRFSLHNISYMRLIPIFLSANIFFGFFALWLASVIRGLSDINSLWMRAINPLWMFGAYFYSWKASFALSPLIGYLSLLNPMVYIMEGTRSAALGAQEYLPYYLCLSALWLFITACAWHSIHRLKKRLDCV